MPGRQEPVTNLTQRRDQPCRKCCRCYVEPNGRIFKLNENKLQTLWRWSVQSVVSYSCLRSENRSEGLRLNRSRDLQGFRNPTALDLRMPILRHEANDETSDDRSDDRAQTKMVQPGTGEVEPDPVIEEDVRKMPDPWRVFCALSDPPITL
jgi:hypothetical protein